MSANRGALLTGSVLLVAPSAYPLGGVAVWLNYLVPALLGQGWQVSAGLVAGRCHNVAAYRLAYPHLPILAINNRTGSAEGRIRAIQCALLELRPQIVVSVNIVDVYAAAHRARRDGLPVKAVMALHGIAADLLGDLFREAPALDAVIATNRLACRLCVEVAGMPPERVLYAPYGVDVDGLGANKRSGRAGPLRIVWVGRLEQAQKRVHDLPAIAAELDRLGVGYVLRIAGDGPEQAQVLQSLEPWIARGVVEYLGALPAADLGPKVYAHADVLLLTSSWETGPIVIWEAMAAGTAVVTTRYVGSGLEGALQPGVNCLAFDVGDAVGAATQLARLASDGDLHAALLRSARVLVRERYSVDASVKSWARCLDEVMALPAQMAPVQTWQPLPSGRLDRLLGVGPAETVRKLLGLSHVHREPGGEWPHTAHTGADEDELLRQAAILDSVS